MQILETLRIKLKVQSNTTFPRTKPWVAPNKYRSSLQFLVYNYHKLFQMNSSLLAAAIPLCLILAFLPSQGRAAKDGPKLQKISELTTDKDLGIITRGDKVRIWNYDEDQLVKIFIHNPPLNDAQMTTKIKGLHAVLDKLKVTAAVKSAGGKGEDLMQDIKLLKSQLTRLEQVHKSWTLANQPMEVVADRNTICEIKTKQAQLDSELEHTLLDIGMVQTAVTGEETDGTTDKEKKELQIIIDNLLHISLPRIEQWVKTIERMRTLREQLPTSSLPSLYNDFIGLSQNCEQLVHPQLVAVDECGQSVGAVSYTHLTLPTICSV